MWMCGNDRNPEGRDAAGSAARSAVERGGPEAGVAKNDFKKICRRSNTPLLGALHHSSRVAK